MLCNRRATPLTPFVLPFLIKRGLFEILSHIQRKNYKIFLQDSIMAPLFIFIDIRFIFMCPLGSLNWNTEKDLHQGFFGVNLGLFD